MSILVRPRVPADLAPLAILLGEQQPTSSYPVRWPLPFEVERFLVRDGELAAWTAEDDGVPLGHVSVLTPGDDQIGRAFREATGRDDLGVVSVLFTGLAARGRGAGGLLLDTAVAWTREKGMLPVLDVVPLHRAAADLYASRGWVEIGAAVRLDWMADHVPDMVLMALPDV